MLANGNYLKQLPAEDQVSCWPSCDMGLMPKLKVNVALLFDSNCVALCELHSKFQCPKIFKTLILIGIQTVYTSNSCCFAAWYCCFFAFGKLLNFKLWRMFQAEVLFKVLLGFFGGEGNHHNVFPIWRRESASELAEAMFAGKGLF